MPAPGPSALGRGVLIDVGSGVPAPWRDAPVVRIDAATLRDPGPTVTRLHEMWAAREPVAVELDVDPAAFREPQSFDIEPWRLDPAAEPWFDRLHFLAWNNNYDARGGDLVWWWGHKAQRLDATLGDGETVWIDGGPRRPWPADAVGGLDVVSYESIEAGLVARQPHPTEPGGPLAADQLAAVGHGAGPARVIAPAGSGKTRVLTERLRHLHTARRYEPQSVLAVAYNKQAQLEMQTRCADFGPRVRTLNSLGLWVLAEHRGRSPQLVEERDVRSIVDSLLPGRRQRRANTDPIGPYLEGLAAIRLGLSDPDVVEESRDDVAGLAEMFTPYRALLADRGVVDFDEQIYGSVETLLRDGAFRRRMQRSCRHLLVDEFQDLTPAHVLLVRLLAMPALDVFGVGDDDQCIYGHASADPHFLIDYATLFPGAAQHPLTVNYRCPVEVVGAASTLLGYNRTRVPKVIGPGPDNDASTGTLRVVEHATDEGAQATVEVVRAWLDEDGVVPGSIAVLARVNSLLLAPHVALHEAGVPLASVLTPDVLGRTGMRAALAYLRIATAASAIDPADIVEILRRPTRGLPQWFPDRLARRTAWSVDRLAGIADQVPERDAAKVLRLADDLRVVVDAGRSGRTRQVLEVVRDDVGLGSAMGLLDRTGGGQGSSHLDDLEGLLGVADLHPDPANFETWLRSSFTRESDAGGVVLSTIHRVKGREWDHIVVFGVADGVLPHRLADDVEEERRVFHVAITRARRRVAVLGDHSRRSPFLDELAGTATEAATRPVVTAQSTRKAARPVPEAFTGDAATAEAALRAWRTKRSKADGVPAYVVVNDKHLRGIAVAQPSSARELVACDGIGPAKLERYGDEILEVLSTI